jgi:hypothetical protein
MYFNDHRRSQRITLAKSSESSLRMIPDSPFGSLNHAAAANLNAASAPVGMSASGRSRRHLLGQSITG